LSDLRALSLPQLEHLLGAAEGGDLKCPISKTRLLSAGFDALVDQLGALQGLDRDAVLAVLRAVIAERRGSRGAELDLVWTGPDHDQGVSRDTAVIVRELLGRAQREVIIGGCYFTAGREILQPLYTAMRERGVRVIFCMDVGDKHRLDPMPLANAQRCAAAFVRDNWLFGEPVPEFYFDPRTAKPGDMTKLHAKCIVVDDRWSLVTSANFTYLGHRRNIEAGVLIDDAAFSTKLARQWRNLIVEGKLLRCPLPDDFRVTARVVPEGWSDAEEYLDEAYAELAAALIDAGVAGPDDYGAELTVNGVLSEHVSLMHWGQGERRVSLVAAHGPIAGAQGTVFYLGEDADWVELAGRVARTLRGAP
jgi:hypothetical protein